MQSEEKSTTSLKKGGEGRGISSKERESARERGKDWIAQVVFCSSDKLPRFSRSHFFKLHTTVTAGMMPYEPDQRIEPLHER